MKCEKKCCASSVSKICAFISVLSRITLVAFWWITLTVVNNPWDYPPITGVTAFLWEMVACFFTAVLVLTIGSMEHRAVVYYWKGTKKMLLFLWFLLNMILPICSTRYLFTGKGIQPVPSFWVSYNMGCSMERSGF